MDEWMPNLTVVPDAFVHLNGNDDIMQYFSNLCVKFKPQKVSIIMNFVALHFSMTE